MRCCDELLCGGPGIYDRVYKSMKARKEKVYETTSEREALLQEAQAAMMR